MAWIVEREVLHVHGRFSMVLGNFGWFIIVLERFRLDFKWFRMTWVGFEEVYVSSACLFFFCFIFF